MTSSKGIQKISIPIQRGSVAAASSGAASANLAMQLDLGSAGATFHLVCQLLSLQEGNIRSPLLFSDRIDGRQDVRWPLVVGFSFETGGMVLMLGLR